MKRFWMLVSIVVCVSILVLSTLSFAQKPPSPSQYTTVAEYEKATGKKIAKFNEAPILTELVKQGKLPPVEKRLPEEPLVVVPVEKVGKYGGTWHLVNLVGNIPGHHPAYIGYEGLVRRSPEGEIIPNLAKSWKIEKGGREYIFYLRKGVKWSDGEPFTADDILYWYEEVLLNKELTPLFPVWLSPGDTPGKVVKIDNYTVKFIFSKPHSLFLTYLASASTSYNEVFQPKHYLKQFHPRYVEPKKLEEETKKEGFTFWYQLYGYKNSWWRNPDRPVLYAWRVKTPVTGGATQWSLERNPYYFKVDTAGNQLPYIDKVITDIVANQEVARMKAMSGEVDFQGFPIGETVTDYSLLMQYKDKGNYRVIQCPIGENNELLFFFSLNHPDKVLKKLFNDSRFRIAMSHAINRKEIMELVYMGVPKDPRQPSPLPQSKYYYEPLAHAYVEYDPTKANQLLDSIGLTKRDSAGFRLRPDGKPLAITIEVPDTKPGWADVAQLISKYWKEVGINTTSRVISVPLLTQRAMAGEFDALMYYASESLMPLISMRGYTPVDSSFWGAYQWYLWYASKGKAGEKPPAEVQHQMALYKQILTTMDEKKRIELFWEILKINAKNLPVLGICERPPIPWVVKNNVKNVPETGWWVDWQMGMGAQINNCQLYIEE